MSRELQFDKEQREWLASLFEGLTTQLEFTTPSKWAESHRYLPQSVSPMPGFYRYSVAPYLREISDCMSVDSPIREVAVKKGAQIGATVGILENSIGYCISHVKTAGCMLLTADDKMAKERVEGYIIPMLRNSELGHLIRSNDFGNKRKSGQTERRIEWEGGGFLIPCGAHSPNNLRHNSVEWLLRDEVNGWKRVVGRDGNPMDLSFTRTNAFTYTRKVLDLSTPTIVGASFISERHARGDQRVYKFCCFNCTHDQDIRWERTDKDTGERSGISWQLSDKTGQLIRESVAYLCEKCGFAHRNEDKTRLFAPENAAWAPTATPVAPYVRSYHIPGLLSPVGMASWADQVQQYLEAVDPETHRPKDLGKYQVFYNNVLAEDFKVYGDKVKLEAVSPHRRDFYRKGQIPNKWCKEHSPSPILLVTMAVDVHKDHLPTAVFGWARGRRCFLLDYFRLGLDEKGRSLGGDTSNTKDPHTWEALRQILREREYQADDGRRYKIPWTVIDSGFNTQAVYEFTAGWRAGVAAVKGKDLPGPNSRIREWDDFSTPMGTRAFGILVDIYKDRLAMVLKRHWNGQDLLPEAMFVAPVDTSSDELKELTTESRHEVRHPQSNQLIGHRWIRPAGARNELWDLLVYGNAGLDILCWHKSKELGFQSSNWHAFWHVLEHDPKHRMFLNG